MALRLIELILPVGNDKLVDELLEGLRIEENWVLKVSESRTMYRILTSSEESESLLDSFDKRFSKLEGYRIIVHSIVACLPRPKDEEKPAEQEPDSGDKVIRKIGRINREELYHATNDPAKLTKVYMVTVALSVIVAAIGLAKNNVAVIIGAMVIAPLLGPVLGFSMGAALGDDRLLKRASLSLAAGIGIVLALSLVLSFVLPINLESRELMSRAEVRLDGLALAMAAGGAAALSLTSSQTAALVGVMVAAALLPPGAAVGLFAGAGEWTLALRAGLLLALNVAALILSALIVFRLRHIRPRSWIEQKNANRAVLLNAVLSAFVLIVSVFPILFLDLGSSVSIG